MITTIYLAMERELVIAREEGGAWRAETRLEGLQPVSLAADPLEPARVYCGTYGRGLWRSEDAGASWRPIGDPLSDWTRSSFVGGIPHAHITAVAVSATERAGGHGVVYAGTEPSALFRSEDRGETWRELAGLRALPSAPEWRFPPRPQSSHVRWIAPDPHAGGRLYVSIEAGAVVRSADGGASWEDRHPDGPRDAHTLAIHPMAPGRLYAAAGDGLDREGTEYAESRDGGDTWTQPARGLGHHYLWGLAVDPADPETVLVSAARGATLAHNPSAAESALYRRVGDGPWRQVGGGSLSGQGALVAVLATNPAEPGTFYALTNRGVYRSRDAGRAWDRLPVPWKDAYLRQRHQALLICAV